MALNLNIIVLTNHGYNEQVQGIPSKFVISEFDCLKLCSMLKKNLKCSRFLALLSLPEAGLTTDDLAIAETGVVGPARLFGIALCCCCCGTGGRLAPTAWAAAAIALFLLASDEVKPRTCSLSANAKKLVRCSCATLT